VKVFELMAQLASLPAGMEVEAAANGEADIFSVVRLETGYGECCILIGDVKPGTQDSKKAK